MFFSLVEARDFDGVVELLHPDVEFTSKVRAGETLRGRDEMARFLREEVAAQTIFETTVAEVRALDENRVIVAGRLRWMDEDRVLRDDPVVWAFEFSEGLVRRTTPTRSVGEAEVLLSARASGE